MRLAGEFYAEAVRPLLDQEFPGLRYAAALLGPGSEVLGFDTERSTDHDWGPRLQVFPEAGELAGAVSSMLAGRLPARFRGYPVAFEVTREPGGGARHRVEVAALGGWLTAALAAGIGDPAIRRLPPAGAADQFIDNTDALGDLRRVRYQIEICPSRGLVIPGPNVGVSNG